MRVTGTARAERHTPAGEAALRWVEGWADHVRRRFGGRALVSVRIGGGEPLALSHVYALESGGIVLVATCGREEEHGHVVPDHHRAVPVAVEWGNGGGVAALRPLLGEPAHGGHTHAGTEHGGAHSHGAAGACADCVELWLASPEHAVLEARRVEDGKPCTGFGYLGPSRTPHMFIARSTEPPKRGHHQHERS